MYQVTYKGQLSCALKQFRIFCGDDARVFYAVRQGDECTLYYEYLDKVGGIIKPMVAKVVPDKPAQESDQEFHNHPLYEPLREIFSDPESIGREPF